MRTRAIPRNAAIGIDNTAALSSPSWRLYPFYMIFGQSLSAARLALVFFSLAGVTGTYVAGRAHRGPSSPTSRDRQHDGPAQHIARALGKGAQMSALRHSWPVAALLAAAVVLIWPLWAAGTPAMQDYPARLAGFYLAAGGANASPLSGFYGIAWAPIPNLAGEIAIPALAGILPLETAAKLFLSLAVAMWVAGPALIHRALYGRIGVAPLVAAFFAYNINFMYGFFNYYFAAGLCFLVFVGWIVSEGWPRWRRLTIFAAAATILYFCHIIAATLFLLLVATFEAARPPISWRIMRSHLVDVAVISLPVAVLVLLKPGDATVSEIHFHILETLLPRIESLVQQSFESPAYGLIMAIALLFAIGVWRQTIVLHPRMHLALIALALGALLLPVKAMGGWGGHLRFPAVAAALLFASCDIRLSRRLTGVLGTAILAALGWLATTLATDWKNYDRQIAEFRAALRDVPRGSRLMTVVDPDVPNDALYWHIAEFAIIDRSAFTALMFTTKGQHIVYLKPAVAPFAAHTADEGAPPEMDDLESLASGQTSDPEVRRLWNYLFYFPCHYDEVVLIHGNGKPASVPGMLKLRREGSFFALYNVRPPRGCSTSSPSQPYAVSSRPVRPPPTPSPGNAEVLARMTTDMMPTVQKR